MRIESVKSNISVALSMIYGIRMGTSADKWTDEQVELIQHIESDLVKLRNSLKSGWAK